MDQDTTLSDLGKLLPTLQNLFVGSGTTTANTSSDPTITALLQLLSGNQANSLLSGAYSKDQAIKDSQGIAQNIFKSGMEANLPGITAGLMGSGTRNNTTAGMMANDLIARLTAQGTAAVQNNINNYAGITNNATQALTQAAQVNKTQTSKTSAAMNPLSSALSLVGGQVGKKVLDKAGIANPLDSVANGIAELLGIGGPTTSAGISNSLASSLNFTGSAGEMGTNLMAGMGNTSFGSLGNLASSFGYGIDGAGIGLAGTAADGMSFGYAAGVDPWLTAMDIGADAAWGAGLGAIGESAAWGAATGGIMEGLGGGILGDIGAVGGSLGEAAGASLIGEGALGALGPIGLGIGLISLITDGCFITTAVCRNSGEPDDCPTLQTLRHFRDTVMLSTKEGKALVAQYYEEAPALVEAINQRIDASETYDYLRHEFIEPAVSAIHLGNHFVAERIYTRMFHWVKELVAERGE